MKDSKNSTAGIGLGIAGLVLGIISIPFASMGCTFMLALILGILGITLSAVGYSQAKRADAQTGLIIAALIISIIGTSFAMLRFTNTIAKSSNIFNNWVDKIDEHSDDIDIDIKFDEDFEEGFEEGYGGDFDDSFDDLEKELEELENELEDMGDKIEETFEGLSEDEKAKKLGKASGKAVRGFVDEINDTTELD